MEFALSLINFGMMTFAFIYVYMYISFIKNRSYWRYDDIVGNMKWRARLSLGVTMLYGFYCIIGDGKLIIWILWLIIFIVDVLRLKQQLK